MRVAQIKSDTGFKIKSNKQLGIQSYDLENNYPQKVEEIVKASGTGLSCVRIYSKFIYGHGFENPDVANVVANRRGETLDYVLKRACRDYAMYHGFALHLNYNALYRITEIYHVPFEHCRFEAKDKDTGTFNRIAVYDDWTGRDPDRKSVRKDNIDFLDMFCPIPNVIEEQVERAKDEVKGATSGWPHYKGQIYYFSGTGEREYPSPIFEAALTNMRSEEGIDNVVARNACSGFMPGVVLVDINNSPENEEQFEQLQNTVRQYQTDENANNILLLQVECEENIPRKIDLTGENYDARFAVSQKYLPDAIGRSFNQPPILRAQDVGANFGADLMTNAYKYYNTQTEDERQDVSGVFTQIFQYWKDPGVLADATIEPLSYDTGITIDDIPSEWLKDLTINERRELLGFGPLPVNQTSME